MQNQLSLPEIDLLIETKQEQIDALGNVRASLLDAITAMEELGNGASQDSPPKKRNNNGNDKGLDLFAGQSDAELADDIDRFLSDTNKPYTIRSLVKELTPGEYSIASKERLHAVAKTMDGVKVVRGGGLRYTPTKSDEPDEPDDTDATGFSDPDDPDDQDDKRLADDLDGSESI